MTLETFSTATFDAVDSIFDFSRPAARAVPALYDTLAPLGAERADPEPGWATRNPDQAMLFLYVTPRDCGAVDELLAL